MFNITQGKGFHMTFNNGVTVSVQFGTGNYCDNYNLPYGESTTPSRNAEVAMWTRDNNWILSEYLHSIGDDSDEDVIGNITPDQLVDMLIWAKNYK